MSTKRTEQVTTINGGQFDGYVFAPDGEPNGNGLLLLQEIFGVGDYIKAVAERLTVLGYTVLAPDLYWRIERGVALGHSEEDLGLASEYAGKFDREKGIEDCGAALAHMRELAEVSGQTGVIGFCFGGTLAYLTAAEHEPDAAIVYYGSGVPDELARAGDIHCPLLLHFGGSDSYIPRDDVAAVEKAAGAHDNFEIWVHEEAGHAFDNHESEMFHNPEAAKTAWDITVRFLQTHL
jgi:carboxymethylenebutenolidase